MEFTLRIVNFGGFQTSADDTGISIFRPQKMIPDLARVWHVPGTHDSHNEMGVNSSEGHRWWAGLVFLPFFIKSLRMAKREAVNELLEEHRESLYWSTTALPAALAQQWLGCAPGKLNQPPWRTRALQLHWRSNGSVVRQVG